MRKIVTTIIISAAVLAGCKEVSDYSETATPILCMDYLDKWSSWNINHDSRMKALEGRVGNPEEVCNQ